MNAQMQEPTAPKKPRMTEKRLREALLAEFKKGYERGERQGIENTRHEYEGDKLIAAMANFAAGTFMGVVAVYPALRWCWHAARAFIIAHAY